MMKSEKRFNCRFTIQLNQNDPRHIKAANFLNTKGRHKAQAVVDAILLLIEETDPSVVKSYRNKTENQTYDRNQNESLRKSNSGLSNQDADKSNNLPDTSSMDSEADPSDILKSISAFRVK